MKITLAFQIFNKEKWIASMMDSWVSNLSQDNEIEVIIIFDACEDSSEQIARKYFEKTEIDVKYLYAKDQFEIYCNNLALENATGDFIIFIQDDNWIYDRNWDRLLADVIDMAPDAGAIGFLAGLRLSREPAGLGVILKKVRQAPGRILSAAKGELVGGARLNYKRVEIDRPHKKENYQPQGYENYEMAVWQVDAVNRPFCVSTKLIRSMGGLDKIFMPQHGDDLDISIKLLKQGKQNIYIPFDLLNLVGPANSKPSVAWRKSYFDAMKICHKRHSKYINGREDDDVRVLFPLKEMKDGNLKLGGEK